MGRDRAAADAGEAQTIAAEGAGPAGVVANRQVRSSRCTEGDRPGAVDLVAERVEGDDLPDVVGKAIRLVRARRDAADIVEVVAVEDVSVAAEGAEAGDRRRKHLIDPDTAAPGRGDVRRAEINRVTAVVARRDGLNQCAVIDLAELERPAFGGGASRRTVRRTGLGGLVSRVEVGPVTAGRVAALW